MARIILHVLAVFLFSTVYVTGKDYQIKQLNIVATILGDGTVEIEEERLYNFKGSFSWVEWTISKRGFGELLDIEVFMDGEPLEKISSGSRENTYRFYDSMRSNYKIRWNFSARNEERVFTHRYRVTEAIMQDDEWAEFNWAFIGRGWEEPTENIRIEIKFENSLVDDEVFTWTRDHYGDFQLTVENGAVVYTTDRIRSSRALNIRTIFNSRAASNLIPADDTIDPFVVDAEYQQWIQERAEREARRAEIAPYANIAGVILIILCFFYTLFMLFKYARNPSLSYQVSDFAENPPEDLSPAVAGLHFSNYEVIPQHLSATVLDLAVKGYIKIRQTDENTKKPVFVVSLVKYEAENLKKWEEQVFNYLRIRLANGEVKMDEVFKIDKKDDDYEKLLAGEKNFDEWYRKFRVNVKNMYRSLNWHKKHKNEMIKMAASQLIFLSLSIVIIIFGDMPYGVVLLIISALGLLLTFTLQPRTETGQQSYLMWKAYRNTLKAGKTSNQNKAKHLVYAIALGLNTDKITKQLNLSTSDDDLFWLFLMPGTTFNPALLTTGLITPLQTSVNSTVAVSVSVSVGAAGGGTGGGAG